MVGQGGIYVASGEFGGALNVADAHVQKETLAVMRRRWNVNRVAEICWVGETRKFSPKQSTKRDDSQIVDLTCIGQTFGFQFFSG